MLTLNDKIAINKDISETIQYCRYKLGNKYGNSIDDLWEQLHRTNQNLQMILSEMIQQEMNKIKDDKLHDSIIDDINHTYGSDE